MSQTIKKQPIQVYVRNRPFTQQEKDLRCAMAVEVTGNKDLIIRQTHGKSYIFDQVFQMFSKQSDIYKTVCKPMIQEVLTGYNCTVFAYGQTGTGKTYTMEGILKTTDNFQIDEEAGIIPRALANLFDELILSQQEYSVRVSYMELYNEEIFDLLNDCGRSLRIYEDQKQKGSVIISELEEVIVHNVGEVFNILQKGSEKRRTAETLMNLHSSRSHSVFTVVVHIRETTEDGEEVMKTGKINFVDLAGSENISRSGAVDKRAREAGNINQSLLTLGRVIKALTEKNSHIPYRESKLTRILQDSLGGRTKTCIIATISPGLNNLEETLSTLDYANRARRITNRPEINQRMSKRALINEYTDEIERLKKDLSASRSGNGIILDEDNYNKLIAEHDFRKQELTERITQIRELESRICDTEARKDAIKNDFLQCKSSLLETQNNLQEFQAKLEQSEKKAAKQEEIINYYTVKGKILKEQATNLLEVADVTTRNETLLIDKINNSYNVINQTKRNVESLISKSNQDFNLYAQSLTDILNESSKLQQQTINDLTERLVEKRNYCSKIINESTNLRIFEDNLKKKIQSIIMKNKENLLKSSEENIFEELENAIPDLISEAKNCVNQQLKRTESICGETVNNFNKYLNLFEEKLQEMKSYNNNTIIKFVSLTNETKCNLENTLQCIDETIKHTRQQLIKDQDEFEEYDNEVNTKLNALESYMKEIKIIKTKQKERFYTKNKSRQDNNNMFESLSTSLRTNTSNYFDVTLENTTDANKVNSDTIDEISNYIQESFEYTSNIPNLVGDAETNSQEELKLFEDNAIGKMHTVKNCIENKFRTINGFNLNLINQIENPIQVDMQEAFKNMKTNLNTINDHICADDIFIKDLQNKMAIFNKTMVEVPTCSNKFLNLFKNNIKDVSTALVLPTPAGDTPIKSTRKYPKRLTSMGPIALDTSLRISNLLEENEDELECNENINTINITDKF